jgi:hypothetical protein
VKVNSGQDAPFWYSRQSRWATPMLGMGTAARRRFAWSTQTSRLPRSAPRAASWAEKVAALYQQGRVYHIGTFPQFEDQMTNFTSDIDRAAAGYSPDRVDALVWAFSELLVEPMNGEGIFELYRRDAEAAAQRSKPQPAQNVP